MTTAVVEQNGSGGTVEVSFKENVATMTLNRGENRLNDQMIEEIHAALDKVESNPNVNALLTTGVGRFYCNGLDAAWLVHLTETDPERMKRFGEKLRKLTERLLTFPMPTIALLNGHTYAAGAILALCHDHVIMQNSRGWWCLNEVHINLTFAPSLVELFKCRIPNGRVLHEATVLGRRYTGEEAVATGIVQESCPPKEIYERAINWVRKMVPPGGFNRQHLKMMKEDVYRNVLNTPNKISRQFVPKL